MVPRHKVGIKEDEMEEILDYGVQDCPVCGRSGGITPLHTGWNVKWDEDAELLTGFCSCGWTWKMRPKNFAPDESKIVITPYEMKESKIWASDGDGSSRPLFTRLKAGEHDPCKEGVRWFGGTRSGFSVRQLIAAMFDEGRFHWACWPVWKYGTEEEKEAVDKQLWAVTGAGCLKRWHHRDTCDTDSHLWDRPSIREAFFVFADRLGADLKAGQLGEYPEKKEEPSFKSVSDGSICRRRWVLVHRLPGWNPYRRTHLARNGAPG